MTSNFDKFTLLLWKNWIIQKRHYIQTVFEIIIPVFCCAILLLVRGLVDPEFIEKSTIFEPQNLEGYGYLPTDPPIEYTIGFSPQNEFLEKIVADAAASLNISYEGFSDGRSMESALTFRNMIVGVEFEQSLQSATALPKKLTVALRFPGELRLGGFNGNWQTRLMMVPFSPQLRSSYSQTGGDPNYYDEGFLAVQTAISKAVIKHIDPSVDVLPAYLRRYPYPPYYDDPILEAMQALLSLIILLSFFYPCIVMVKHITVEKEKQLKEAMKIMGLSNWLHWSAWFVKNILLLIISISLITGLLCASINGVSILEYSNWTAVWFFLFVYAVTTICFCFMMSVFFNKANMASGIAGLMWFVFVMPYNIASPNYDSISTGAKIGLSLFSNSAMSFGVVSMIRMEANQIGLRWDSMFTPATIDDGFSVGLAIVMMLVDAAIYLAIALYVEQVRPGEFGVAKPWNFLFKKEYWVRRQMEATIGEQNGVDRRYSKFFEQEPQANAGIQIRNLRKVFGGNKTAVEGLNVNMYEDQITVLLGHNGAGKTTTMSMLTGMFSPTSGTAYVNGYDIRTNIEGVRQSLGLCPQHNVLFDEMTVAEHISFFASLKGVPGSLINDEIDKYLKTLEITDKRNAQSHTLSGGMKRKLAVGVALCGGSKVVMLDEPTSGMDPSARRALWDLLQREKKNRTMLLSTHFMDEADVLGDRIAIMAEGVLKTVGSPFFLKKTFGVGYKLICVKGANCDKELLLSLLRRHIPDARIETDIGTELSFVLKEEYIKVFQTMLEELESKTTQCGITSYGISLTTMEEVFLKAGSDRFYQDDSANETAIPTSNDSYSLQNVSLLEGHNLLVNQVKGQLLKKALSTLRSWVQFLIQNGIPIFFLVMTFVISRSVSLDEDLPPLKITMESYGQTVTVVEGNADTDAQVQAYRKIFEALDSSHRLDLIKQDMVDYILTRSKESLSEVNVRYMVGATFGEQNLTAWFNNMGLHTAPLAVSLLYNAVIGSRCEGCELTIINKPLPYRLSTQLEISNTGMNAGFQLAFNTGFAMAFVAALYILFYVKERTTRAKLLQYVSGTNIVLFWGVAFIWDYLTYIVTCLIYIATLAAFQEDGWSSFDELGRTFLLLLMYGIGFLPTTYLASFLFKVPATAFVVVMLINIASGSIFFTAVVLLKFPGIDLNSIAEALEWVFLLFPNFVLTHGMNNMNQIVSIRSSCEQLCDLFPGCPPGGACGLRPDLCCLPDVFSFDKLGINRHLLYLALVGISAFALILAIELRVFEQLLIKIFAPRTKPMVETEQDSDVLAEKARVQRMPSAEINSHNLVMQNLTKYYKSMLAVNNLSVAIDKYECFGLLGINGAGKTTTFKMMTGDERISSGDAWVKGINLKSAMAAVYQQIGYCPQFDALLGDLTGRETLRIYALLRGIREADINNVSLTLAEELNFLKHIDKKTSEYSGGNKRKLSTALALLGNPSVVYLDEPTTGMDPGAKRQFWDMICKVRSAGKSIVLTSHSMEECEALCTRLAIMVNGEFKCLGSTQHLKNKFSKGFLLTIKVKKADHPQLQQQRVEQVKYFVSNSFNGAALKEEHQDSLSYHVPQTDLKWSTMFGLMESNKEQLSIEDYALGQTTLEQVFLFFTKYQRIV